MYNMTYNYNVMISILVILLYASAAAVTCWSRQGIRRVAGHATNEYNIINVDIYACIIHIYIYIERERDIVAARVFYFSAVRL